MPENLEARLNDWLDLGPDNQAPARAAAKLQKRQQEVKRLEAKLFTQANALALTVARLKKARRSAAALKRAKRKLAARAPKK